MYRFSYCVKVIIFFLRGRHLLVLWRVMSVGLGGGGALVVAVAVDDVEGEADGVRWRVHLESELEMYFQRPYYVVIDTHKCTLHFAFTHRRG